MKKGKLARLNKTLAKLSFEQLVALWESNRKLLNEYRRAKVEAAK